MSRYHLALEALRRARRAAEPAQELAAHCHDTLERHHDYIREHLEDLPEVRDRVWDPTTARPVHLDSPTRRRPWAELPVPCALCGSSFA